MDALIWRDPRSTFRKLKVLSAELICNLRRSPDIANPQQAEEDMSFLNRKLGPTDVLFEAGLAMSRRRQDGAAQACRPYLSVTAAATNFLRPALPGLVPWAAHQSGNVAGSM